MLFLLPGKGQFSKSHVITGNAAIASFFLCLFKQRAVHFAEFECGPQPGIALIPSSYLCLDVGWCNQFRAKTAGVQNIAYR